MSVSAQPDRPVIRLNCPSDEVALCRALVQALAEAAPGAIIRPVAPGDERPSRPMDIGVALMRTENGFFLAWRDVKGPLHRGGVVNTTGSGAASLPQNDASRVAQTLLKASSGLLDLLPGN